MLAAEGHTDLWEPQVIADCHAKPPWGTVTADQLQRSTERDGLSTQAHLQLPQAPHLGAWRCVFALEQYGPILHFYIKQVHLQQHALTLPLPGDIFCARQEDFQHPGEA